VQPYQHPVSGLRHILFLALLGVGVVFLSGPVIAIASVVLSLVLAFGVLVVVFAAIGFLVWAPAYFFYAGRQAAGERIGAMGRTVGGTMRYLAHVGSRAFTIPIRFTSRLFRGGLSLARTTTEFVGEVLIVALTGAAIGAALGLTISATGQQDPAQVIPLNAAAGAGIAAAVGLVLASFSRRGSTRRQAAA
jgi:hypothetical protein